MSNPKNLLQERMAKFTGSSIVYDNVASGALSYYGSVTVTLTSQGITKTWTANSSLAYASKKEAHFDAAQVMLENADLAVHWNSVPAVLTPLTVAVPPRTDKKGYLLELFSIAKSKSRCDPSAQQPVFSPSNEGTNFIATVTFPLAGWPQQEGAPAIVLTGPGRPNKKAAEQAVASLALAHPIIRQLLEPVAADDPSAAAGSIPASTSGSAPATTETAAAGDAPVSAPASSIEREYVMLEALNIPPSEGKEWVVRKSQIDEPDRLFI